MKILKLTLFCVLFMILSVSVLAQGLTDYPDFLVEKGNQRPYIVVGDQAPAQDVVTAMGIALTLQFEMNKNDLLFRPAKLSSQIDDLYARNLIVVGTEADNPIVNKLTDLNLKSGEGVIKLLNKNDKFQVIVSGYSTDDVEAAAKILNRFKNYRPVFTGDTIFVRNGVAYAEDGSKIDFGTIRPLRPTLNLPPGFGTVRALNQPTVGLHPSVQLQMPEENLQIPVMKAKMPVISTNEIVVKYSGNQVEAEPSVTARTYVI